MSTQRYLHGRGIRTTRQTEPMPGFDQIEDHEGGYVFKLDKFDRLQRFLILGSEGGSYYASQNKLTTENVTSARECLEEDHKRAVDLIVTISDEGRAPSNDPAIWALALACSIGTIAEQRYALDQIPKVCRIGTHLFTFASFIEENRGWGRALRRAIAAWYERDVDKVAYQAVKYRQRNGWSHRDLLRLSHPKAEGDIVQSLLFGWISHPDEWNLSADPENLRPIDDPLAVLEAYERAQRAVKPAETVALIKEYGGLLPREALQTEHLSDQRVNIALLEQGMPMTALIRNLANLTRYDVLRPMGSYTQLVVDQITNADALQKARMHPLTILMAKFTYQAGHGYRGTNTWDPVAQIVDALEDAFYLAFYNVEPTNKAHVLALDVSGSMSADWAGYVGNIPGFTPQIAAAAMAMVTARTEQRYVINGFAGDFRDLGITARMSLDEAIRRTSALSFGGTDCAVPMLWALENGVSAETFCVYTDSETWSGHIHPAQALRKYRRETGIPAKLIVVGMVSNGFTIADPNDGGMLDVVGMDTATPAIMADFTRS